MQLWTREISVNASLIEVIIALAGSACAATFVEFATVPSILDPRSSIS